MRGRSGVGSRRCGGKTELAIVAVLVAGLFSVTGRSHAKPLCDNAHARCIPTPHECASGKFNGAFLSPGTLGAGAVCVGTGGHVVLYVGGWAEVLCGTIIAGDQPVTNSAGDDPNSCLPVTVPGEVSATAPTTPEDFGTLPYTITHNVPLVLGPDPEGAVEPFGPDRFGAADGAYPILVADLYVPKPPGRYPLVQISHGSADDKADWAQWGKRLASRGFVVVTSNRRVQNGSGDDNVSHQDSNSADKLGGLSFNVNTEDILRILRWAITQSSKAVSSPLYHKVDSTRLAITGHSRGGYFDTLAAYRSQIEGPKLKAIVLFDPGDDTNKFRPADPADLQTTANNIIANTLEPDALTYGPKLQVATAIIAGEEDEPGGSCPEPRAARCGIFANQEWVRLAPTTPKLGLKVVCSHHNESEDPDDDDAGVPGGIKFTDPICPGVPPAPAPARQTLIKRYAMAWLEYWLQSDCAAVPYLGGSAFAQDQAARLITTLPADANVMGANDPNPNHITNTRIVHC